MADAVGQPPRVAPTQVGPPTREPTADTAGHAARPLPTGPPPRRARLSSGRIPPNSLIPHNRRARKQRQSYSNEGPWPRPSRRSLRRPAHMAEAAGFAGAYPLRQGRPPAPTLGGAPKGPHPQAGWRVVPSPGPLNARRRREWSCPKTLIRWKWIPLQRTSNPRPLTPSWPPWPTPS